MLVRVVKLCQSSWRLFSVLFAANLLLVQGCATQTALHANMPFNVNYWLAEGKMGLKYPECSDSGRCESKAINASFTWQHQPNVDSLRLYDPSGQARLLLDYRDGRVRIRDGERDEWVSVAVLSERFGVRLPLTSIADWVTKQQVRTQWESDGWHISVADWQGDFYRKITLFQDESRVRLVLYSMQPTRSAETL